MIAFRKVYCFLVLTLPLQALAGQAGTGSPPKMTPEQRAAAQAKLDLQVSQLTSQSLDVPRTQLRDAAAIMRDSISAIVATTELISRAQSTKSVGVERSQARQLRGQCAAALRTSEVTLAAIAKLNTPDPKGTQLLLDYREALNEVSRRMVECDKALAVTSGSAPLSSARINTATGQVSVAAARHNRALGRLIHALDISLPNVR